MIASCSAWSRKRFVVESSFYRWVVLTIIIDEKEILVKKSSILQGRKAHFCGDFFCKFEKEAKMSCNLLALML